ncbi:MAG TPA: cytochrome c oxidase subunit II, partial [Hyphomonas sp.]|nr:cytochrome c oxidase subunit II [Hyphomonas sp.]
MASIKTMASLLLRVLVILSILVLAGCNGPLSTLDPSGPRAAMVAMLWWAMFWSSVALFGLMMALLALVWVRPGFGSKLAPSKWII